MTDIFPPSLVDSNILVHSQMAAWKIPSGIETAPDGSPVSQWSSLAEAMNDFFSSAKGSRIWVRDFQVDRPNTPKYGSEALNAYLLYRQPTREFDPAFDQYLGLRYRAEFVIGPPTSEGFDNFDSWAASEFQTVKNNRSLLPKHIIPVTPKLSQDIPSGAQYFILGIDIGESNSIAQILGDTTVFIAEPKTDIESTEFGEVDLYDCTGHLIREGAQYVYNVHTTTWVAGELGIVTPDLYSSGLMGMPMCCG